MTNRERLDTLSEVIAAHHEAGNKELQDAWRLEKERMKTFAAIIQEEGLLTGSWSFCDDKSQWINLEADEMWEEFPGLRALLKPDYHEVYSLWEEPCQTLHFDDGTLTLQIPQEKVSQFVKDHNIIIELERLVDRRNDLVDQLNVTTNLLTEMRALTPMSRHRQRAIRPPREF